MLGEGDADGVDDAMIVMELGVADAANGTLGDVRGVVLVGVILFSSSERRFTRSVGVMVL